MLAVLLTSCGLIDKTGITADKAQDATHKTICASFKAISYSVKSDSSETIEEILAHNRVLASYCS